MTTRARILGSAVSAGGVIQRDGAVKSYSSVNDLPSSPDIGEFAFVLSNQSPYMWDGTKWDRVYLGANMLPEWTTEPNTAYQLAIDGTPTTITTLATDPEGFPIVYSYDTNPSNQTQASIMNNSDGTFTLTPSTDSSDAGEFTFRIKATDGLHVSSKSSLVNLRFIQFISLSGGTGGNTGGATTYTAPNGTIVTVTDGVYSSSGNYFIGYMFTGTYGTNANEYYLGSGAATGSITLNFTSAPINYIGYIRVYPYCRSDSFSNITSIQRSSNGTNWTDVYLDQGLTPANSPQGTSYRYDLNTTDKYIRLNLSRTGMWGVSMNEIQVYAV